MSNLLLCIIQFYIVPAGLNVQCQCCALCDVMAAVLFHEEAGKLRPLCSDWMTHLSIMYIRCGRGNTRLCASGNEGEKQGERKREINTERWREEEKRTFKT